MKRVLTGITTTGSPHLGNYVGAIRPAIAASRAAGTESFYFLADYHALIKCQEPGRVQRSTLEIAASWLALGLDPGRVFFYRQSDIPEIPELTWLLACVAAKGLLNRAHAYKAAVDANTSQNQDPDAGVSMAQSEKPDVILLDVILPGVDGRDALKRLKADAATRHIPVVMYSARGGHSDRRLGLELGADEYIDKPFDADMLLRRLEHLVWKKRSTP